MPLLTSGWSETYEESQRKNSSESDGCFFIIFLLLWVQSNIKVKCFFLFFFVMNLIFSINHLLKFVNLSTQLKV